MDQWNKMVSPEINPHTYRQLFFDKGDRNIQWGKDGLISSGAGKVGQLRVNQ